MNKCVSCIIFKGYKSQLVEKCSIAVIVSIIFIIGGTVALKNNKIGGMSRELGWKGACGASVFVFVGGEGNITGQAGFVRDVVYHMKGDKSRDIGKAHWALMRAKTI